MIQHRLVISIMLPVVFQHYIYTTIGKGLDDRFNQTLQSMFVKLIEDKKDTWEEYFDTCVFAYNTAHHESTQRVDICKEISSSY